MADLGSTTTAELIDHIVNTHHMYLRRELATISRFVTGLYRGHGETHPELAELHIRFHRMKAEMEHHMLAEEVSLFPLIRQAERRGIGDARPNTMFKIGEIEAEHDAITATLRVIRDITVDYHLPDQACETFRATSRKLREIEQDISRHIHLESDLLFPKYRELCGA